MSTNDAQQQKTDEERIKEARELLDNVNAYFNRFGIDTNKKRKKLKRWFKECAKKKYDDAQKGELCCGVNEQKCICLGKKAQDNKSLETPFLFINPTSSNVCIQINDKEGRNINNMTYDEFYKYYDKIIGGHFLTNVWDSFASITELPRQYISGNNGKATSPGGHVANIATRVFFPVVATATGAFVGGLAACVGAKALKDKIIPTEEELRAMAGKIGDSYYLKGPLLHTDGNNNNSVNKAITQYNNHMVEANKELEKQFKKLLDNPNDYRNQMQIMDCQKECYHNILMHDLKEINRLSKSPAQQQQ